MASNPNYRPKLSIELTREQQKGLQDINLPHGWQRRVFSAIIDELIELNAVYGSKSIACIMGSNLSPSDILHTMNSIPAVGKILKGEDL